jgi:hypothetical protein
MNISIILISLLSCLLCTLSQNLITLVKEHHIGGTFCKYLAWKMQIHHKTYCDNPTCNWDTWQDALRSTDHESAFGQAGASGAHHYKATKQVDSSGMKKKSQQNRVLVSYGHNGFGNQLWQHTVAFMIAESLNAKLFIAIIPDEMSPSGGKPPNTWAGMAAMEKILPPEFLYENLPKNSSIRSLCDQEDWYVKDRPIDWRDRNYTTHFKPNLWNLITDTGPRCIKMLGYFQNLPLCADDVRRLWTTKMFARFPNKPGENDLSIYLRCVPRHYHFNDKVFYETILENIEFDKIWIFGAPECPHTLDADSNRDGMVAAVVRLLVEKYNGTRWPAAPSGSDPEVYLLSDLAGLAQSKKLLLPVSSWAFWAGMLSNASEIHVNSPPRHPLLPDMPHYIYHDDRAKKYFGKFDTKEMDIIYGLDLNNPGAKLKKPLTAAEIEKKKNASAVEIDPMDAIEAIATALNVSDVEDRAEAFNVSDALNRVAAEIMRLDEIG